MNLLICCIVFLSTFCFTLEETIDFNPYEVLDLDRSVSTADIRSAYKKLAKEWHPDKNKSPNAQDKFIKIQQAYEILSDENKREQYDTGGYSGDSVGQWQHYGEATAFRYSDFTSDFFNSHGSIRTLSMHDYYSRVLPESHNTPHLLYVYSTFCAQCVLWLRTSWQKAASNLESLGVVVYTVDTTFTSRIAYSLGVTRVPTIVGMYKEQVHFFKGQISKEELKLFVNSILPDNVITTVTSSSIQLFLSEIEADDKPRVILFSDKVLPTLLYRLMALKYQQYYRFGYVNMKDQNSEDVAKNFAVSQYGPTLLVFKDTTGNPAVVLGASEMPRGAINDILSSNRFVVMPRLTSQAVFDEMCAAPHGAAHNTRLCMILVSDPSFKDHAVISSNLKSLVAEAESNEESLNEWMTFINVYTSKQPAFTRSLLSAEINQAQIILLWRRGQMKASVKQLDVDFLRQPLAAAKSEFQTCLRTALEVAHLQQFQTTVTLSPLVDELAPVLVLRILRRIVMVAEYVYSFLASLGERQMMATIITTILIILWINSAVAGQSEDGNSRHASENADSNLQGRASQNFDNSTDKDSTDQGSTSEYAKSTNRQSAGGEAGDTDQSASTFANSPKKQGQVKPQPNPIQELAPSLYNSSVLNQSRGHMTIVLLLDNESASKPVLVEEYEKAMSVFLRDPKITVTFLDVRKYSSWFHEIRRSSSAEPPDNENPPNENTESPEISSLHANTDFDEGPQSKARRDSKESPAEACGTVLALNGFRHWYCIFVPRGVKWGRKNESHTDQGDSQTARGEESSYAAVLSCWMDRVREGQVPRLYVRQWPGLYSRTDDVTNEEDEF